MAKAHEAADAIRRMAKQYEQMVVAAETLEKIGSLEQATTEMTVQRDAAAVERDAVLAELAKAKCAVVDAKNKAAERLANAELEAESIVENAKATADLRAKEIFDDAETRADALIRAAEAKRADALAAAAAARGDVEIAKGELAAIELQVAERGEVAAALEKRIAKAQEKMAKMLGE
jgi:hypothetical protein